MNERPTQRLEAPFALDATPEGGVPFGSYQLIKRIGSGGMAQVYLAQNEAASAGLSRQCVIKRITPEFAGLDSFQRMLAQEARIMARLDHPNIVQVLDFGQVNGVHFLAMEWVNGPSLSQLIVKARDEKCMLGPSVVAAVGMAVALALDHAKSVKDPETKEPVRMIHRDVSPGNILVSHTGAIKLADFGVAKLTDLANDHTRPGVLKGKFGYLAPERLSGSPANESTDVFSLGVVLWEVATGRRLFRGDSEVETLAAVQRCSVPSPTKFNADFPQELSQVILKAAAKEPNARFSNAHEVHCALDELRKVSQWNASHRSMVAIVDQLFPDGVAGSYDDLHYVDGVAAEALTPPEPDELTPVTPQPTRARSNLPIVLAVVGTLIFWLFVLTH